MHAHDTDARPSVKRGCVEHELRCTIWRRNTKSSVVRAGWHLRRGYFHRNTSRPRAILSPLMPLGPQIWIDETGTSVLKGVDEYMALLDEHITMTQAMTFSTFKGPFEERIENWNSTLQVCSTPLVFYRIQWLLLFFVSRLGSPGCTDCTRWA